MQIPFNNGPVFKLFDSEGKYVRNDIVMNLNVFCVVDSVCSQVGPCDKHFDEKHKKRLSKQVNYFCNKIL